MYHCIVQEKYSTSDAELYALSAAVRWKKLAKTKDLKNTDKAKKAKAMQAFWETLAKPNEEERKKLADARNQYMAVNALLESLHSQYKEDAKDIHLFTQYGEGKAKEGKKALTAEQQSRIKEVIALIPKTSEDEPIKKVCAAKTKEMGDIGNDIRALEDMAKKKKDGWKKLGFGKDLYKPPYSLSDLVKTFFTVKT